MYEEHINILYIDTTRVNLSHCMNGIISKNFSDEELELKVVSSLKHLS